MEKNRAEQIKDKAVSLHSEALEHISLVTELKTEVIIFIYKNNPKKELKIKKIKKMLFYIEQKDK